MGQLVIHAKRLLYVCMSTCMNLCPQVSCATHHNQELSAELAALKPQLEAAMAAAAATQSAAAHANDARARSEHELAHVREQAVKMFKQVGGMPCTSGHCDVPCYHMAIQCHESCL